MNYENNWIEGSGYREVMLKISSKDLVILQSAIKPAYETAKKKYEKLRDIHEGGEATEKQCDQLHEALDRFETLHDFITLK